MNNSLGQKIKSFRLKSGLSQFELEDKIGASPGSLSRIENGQINPTKETLIKVIDSLDLKSFEAGSLFDLDFDELPKLVQLARKVSSSLDLDKVLQNAVNEIALELDLLGVVICIIEGDQLFAKTFTQSWYTKLVLNIMQVPFNSLKIDLDTDKKNYMVWSIRNKKEYRSDRLFDFTRGALSEHITDLSQKVSGHKSAISFPIIYEAHCLGSILFTKGYISDFENEYLIFKNFAEYIGVAINNANQYAELQKEIDSLKNGK